MTEISRHYRPESHEQKEKTMNDTRILDEAREVVAGAAQRELHTAIAQADTETPLAIHTSRMLAALFLQASVNADDELLSKALHEMDCPCELIKGLAMLAMEAYGMLGVDLNEVAQVQQLRLFKDLGASGLEAHLVAAGLGANLEAARDFPWKTDEPEGGRQ